MSRIDWPPILRRAAEIVLSYDIPVTLRQLFYRCVMELLIPNRAGAYKTLSDRTAKLRRTDQFPALFDRGRKILQPPCFADPVVALDALIGQYRVDRTAGQPVVLWLGVEKNALAGLLEDWFYELGVPVLPLGGYSSEPIDRLVKRRVAADGRPAVLIYTGDFDASGMDIGRSFIETTNCWKHTIRIGLSEQQINDFGLPVLRGKPGDSRAPKFIERFPEIHARHYFGCDEKGRRIPVQVELDALDPAVLRDQFLAAMAEYWDQEAYNAALDREDADLSTLRELATRLG